MSTNEITAKVRKMKRLQAKADELNDEIKAIQDEIKAEMLNRNTEEMSVGQYIVRWTSVLSNRFDTTGFKKMYADLYKEYTKQSASRRFTISA